MQRFQASAAAVGLIAAAGIVAVVAVSTRSTITTETAPATTGAPPSTAPATTSTTAITTTTISATTTVAPTPGPLRRVEFQRGTNNTSVTDEIGPGTSDRFVLEATSEQRMIVDVDAAIPDITFSIFAPDGTPLTEDEVVAAVELPADGDYVVEVTTTGAGGEYVIDFLIN